MKNKCYFISDVHLQLESKEKERTKENLLVKLLKKAEEDASDFFILGDLFDYWFDFREVCQKGNFRVLTALQDLVESGTNVHYLIGNHDFYHTSFFESEIGTKLYENPIDSVLNGKKFYLGHGDGLIKNDIGYRILKFFLRNKGIQYIASFLHPDFILKLARNSSKASRKYTTQKHYGEIDGLKEAATNCIANGFDYVIFGHSHNFENLQINNGKYINLGSWINLPCYAEFNNNELRIINLENGNEIL